MHGASPLNSVFGGHTEGTSLDMACSVPFLAVVLTFGMVSSADAQTSQREAELRKLMPHVTDACAVVKTTPQIFPYRSFTYGPLGLEVRKANSPAEAGSLRNFYLGVVASACGVGAEDVTAHFFCGPDCPANRREHLARQLPAIRGLAASFRKLIGLRILAVWAPKGDLRVNDVFQMTGVVREAMPSPTMGLVPSGDWKPWPSLAAYLNTIKLPEDTVARLTQQMLAIGLSALIREGADIRLVGVGVGDNESGLLLTARRTLTPQVGARLPDMKTYSIVERLAPDLYYYETN